jgi:hypothetical protein
MIPVAPQVLSGILKFANIVQLVTLRLGVLSNIAPARRACYTNIKGATRQTTTFPVIVVEQAPMED